MNMLDWTTMIIEKTGYLGVVFAMFLENIFPPIPSELIMIFSGATAGKGDLNIVFVILAAGIGSTLGLIPWYYAGKWYGQERLKELTNQYGRVLTISRGDLSSASKWFKKYGKVTVLIARFLPGVRTLVAIPAAIMKMNLKVFLLFAFLGSLVWDGLFGVLGYYIGENSEALTDYVDIGTYIVLGMVIIWYCYRVFTFKKK